MKVIISPAKKMKIEEDIEWKTVPVFLSDAQKLQDAINDLSSSEKKAMWNCSDAIAKDSERIFAHMDLNAGQTPSLFSYNGIQYQNMAPEAFTTDELDWLQDHLRILSGFYGVLKPFDGIVPYRLEMQAKLNIDGHTSLYHFWGRKLYQEVMDDSHVLINLASKEYSDAITPYIDQTYGDRLINIIFGVQHDQKITMPSVYAKMARGRFVRWMAENQIEDISDFAKFNDGYTFSPDHSDEMTLVFLQQPEAIRCN
ncbi:peroxide stress protein YaaA [Galactobacillus timonensis]|uniref:peroxide stress protein YaaA n=1 Tax=Galactobacillus timonensis TaxID=2041840 RepID=UPI002409E47F|nr:peroxide stress protein YaaA [Galactobacillus timonensis]MDD6679975.1 peroxide stress protein YaaA [Galactobacillus timonensis]